MCAVWLCCRRQECNNISRVFRTFVDSARMKMHDATRKWRAMYGMCATTATHVHTYTHTQCYKRVFARWQDAMRRTHEEGPQTWQVESVDAMRRSRLRGVVSLSIMNSTHAFVVVCKTWPCSNNKNNKNKCFNYQLLLPGCQCYCVYHSPVVLLLLVLRLRPRRVNYVLYFFNIFFSCCWL